MFFLLTLGNSYAQIPSPKGDLTVLGISKVIFNNCKTYNQKCIDSSLAKFNCFLNNPLSQDPTSQDGIVNGEKKQCINGVESSSVKLWGEFEGEENFPEGSYSLVFDVKDENLKAEVLGSRKITKRFSAIDEYIVNDLVIAKYGQSLMITPVHIWKKGEFTFLKNFTIDKTSRADLEDAKKHKDFGLLLGGKGKIFNPTFDNNGILIEFIVSTGDRTLAEALRKAFDEKFGKPTLTYSLNEVETAEKSAKTLEGWRAMLKYAPEQFDDNPNTKLVLQEIVDSCRRIEISLGTMVWESGLVRISIPFSSMGCSRNLEKNFVILGGKDECNFKISSQRYLKEIEELEQNIKEAKRREKQKQLNEVKELF